MAPRNRHPGRKEMLQHLGRMEDHPGRKEVHAKAARSLVVLEFGMTVSNQVGLVAHDGYLLQMAEGNAA